MVSFRLYKYSKEDLNENKEKSYLNNLKRFFGDIKEREWVVSEESINENSESSEVSFQISKQERKEVLTLDGLKEMVFIEEYPIIVFLKKQIIAIGKSTSKSTAEDLRECFEVCFLNKDLKYGGKYLESSDELLNKLKEDESIEVVGFDSKNTMGIDKVSGHDRFDLRNKKIYEEACSGTFTGMVYIKKFSDPIGKIKFCIRANGLITIFKRTLDLRECALVLDYLLKFLQNPTHFTRTLKSFT